VAPTTAKAQTENMHTARRVGTAARPHLMVTHYTELEETKGLVLVRGDVLSPHVVSVPEVLFHFSPGRANLTFHVSCHLN
jgi:hypothetical protein